MKFTEEPSILTEWWWRSREWPRGNSRHVFLAAVLHEVGETLVDGWTGDEPAEAAGRDWGALHSALKGTSAKLIPAPCYAPTLADHPTNDSYGKFRAHQQLYEEQQWKRADSHVRDWRRHQEEQAAREAYDQANASMARLTQAMNWIADNGVEDGRLLTRGRLVATGGDFFDLPPHIWGGSPGSLWPAMFSLCRLRHRGLDAHIFITRESLDRYLRPESVGSPRPEQALQVPTPPEREAEEDSDPAVSRTKPKPFWYPKLRDEFIAKDRREAEFKLAGKTPPVFPIAAKFRTTVANRLGVDEERVELDKVRYHLRALKKEFGRD